MDSQLTMLVRRLYVITGSDVLTARAILCEVVFMIRILTIAATMISLAMLGACLLMQS